MKDLLQRIGFVAGFGIASVVNGCTTTTEKAVLDLRASCEHGAETFTIRKQKVRRQYVAGILISGESLWPARSTLYDCRPFTLPHTVDQVYLPLQNEVINKNGSRHLVQEGPASLVDRQRNIVFYARDGIPYYDPSTYERADGFDGKPYQSPRREHH